MCEYIARKTRRCLCHANYGVTLVGGTGRVWLFCGRHLGTAVITFTRDGGIVKVQSTED